METVLVTGFGPFGDIAVNPSWEVAKELQQLDWEGSGLKLVIEEIPVVYKIVSETIPELWRTNSPTLMVHIGVSKFATELTLETCAHRTGYDKLDINNEVPEKDPGCETSASFIKTCIDIEEVSLQFNATNNVGVESIVSADAGRYLCEFTFYSSLCMNPERTVFIHVPNIGGPYTVPQMAEAVKQIILLLIQQIHCKCPKK